MSQRQGRDSSSASGSVAVVLLVDSHGTRGESLRQALAPQADIALNWCTDIAQAVNMAVQLKPTVILQVHTQADDADLALLKAWREHSATVRIPVVLLADSYNATTATTAFQLGASDYLPHAPEPTELVARVHYHSRAYRAQQQLEQTAHVLHDTQKQLTEASQQLEQITHSDGLTGLPNRRRFDDYLDMEWRRAIRDQTTLSLLMVDVDYFKSYNDSFGHLQGDQALSRIGLTLRETCARPADLAARYGGEVFVVVLPNTGEEGARLIAEKIRLSIMALAIEHEETATRAMLTVSIGVATRVPQTGPAITLLGLADEALYHAKTTGRNRVEVAVGH